MIIKTETVTKSTHVTKFIMEKVEGTWSAIITLETQDEQGNKIDEQITIVQKEEWNSFGENFDKWTDLDEYANTKLGINGEIDPTTEQEYKN